MTVHYLDPGLTDVEVVKGDVGEDPVGEPHKVRGKVLKLPGLGSDRLTD